MNNERKWRPIDIQVLLHHYCIAEPYLPDSQSYRSAVARLETSDLLEEKSANPSGYEPTRRGQALIAVIMSTPLPMKADAYVNGWTGDVIREVYP